MALSDESQQLQNPPMALDALFCEEESFDEALADDSDVSESIITPVLLENDLFWEDDELTSLIGKEEAPISDLSSDSSAEKSRREGVDWILAVQTHYGFSSLTAVLAVNYFDRFVSSLQFQRDKPWMSQLAAVACLSLAAKVEETQVPLLLDLQVEESGFVFEAKTIQRMELLVLSTLKWKMHPVTPIYFFNHIVRRLGLKTHLHWEFLWSCEKLLLSLIPDIRFARYLPSVLATATMLHVINEIEPFNMVDYQNQLLSVLKINKDTVKECYMLISGSHGKVSQKRKHMSVPGSPSGVVDALFSSDSSNDSWASSVEPRFKRSRVQDQQMRLAPPMNSFSVDVLTSPR